MNTARQSGNYCAKRLECAELAPAFEPPFSYDSASKLDALQTLRVAVHPRSYGRAQMGGGQRIDELGDRLR